VVARLAFAEGRLALVALDHDLLQARGDRRGAEREIDPESPALVERAGLVVPVGIEMRLGVERAQRIGVAEVLHGAETPA